MPFTRSEEEVTSVEAEAMGLDGTMKPCPFCGSTNIDAAFGLDGEGHVNAGCMDCGASGPDCNSERPSAAADAWNARISSTSDADMP